MAASMARTSGATPAVKMKCLTCGALEDENATYCRKRGHLM